MSATDPESLRTLASLARLELGEDELRAFAPELERILAAFEVLARHTPAPPPPLLAAAPPSRARPGRSSGPARPGHTREDEPLPSLPRERLLAAAPASEDGFFVVPKTVGGAR
jgi:aspartyl-tRNA(Asn)/glutamyl-tRNA(Gln) amidotransferase subunit C